MPWAYTAAKSVHRASASCVGGSPRSALASQPKGAATPEGSGSLPEPVALGIRPPSGVRGFCTSIRDAPDSCRARTCVLHLFGSTRGTRIGR